MIAPRDLRTLPPLARIPGPLYAFRAPARQMGLHARANPPAWSSRSSRSVDLGRETARLRSDAILHMVEACDPKECETLAAAFGQGSLDALTVRDHARYMAAAGQS